MDDVTFDDVQTPDALPAFKEPGTNALVHDPFSWSEENAEG